MLVRTLESFNTVLVKSVPPTFAISLFFVSFLFKLNRFLLNSENCHPNYINSHQSLSSQKPFLFHIFSDPIRIVSCINEWNIVLGIAEFLALSTISSFSLRDNATQSIISVLQEIHAATTVATARTGAWKEEQSINMSLVTCQHCSPTISEPRTIRAICNK